MLFIRAAGIAKLRCPPGILRRTHSTVMHHDTSDFLSTDGLRLFTRRWTPDGGAQAVVVLVHGMHEHSGRYAYLASKLMEAGLEVSAFDLRGHGQSDGERGFVESLDELVADLHAFLALVRLESADRPVFLMGHSMGGLIASAHAVDCGSGDLAGIILSSPALEIPAPAPLRAIAPYMSRWFPRMPTTGVDLTKISRDPVVQRNYAADPLNINRGVRARLGYEILRTAVRIREQPEVFNGPLYLFHGDQDSLTAPAGSQWLAENAASDDVTLRLWPDLRHETMNEPERDQVIEELTDWIISRLPRDP